jgi:hypothetical protein
VLYTYSLFSASDRFSMTPFREAQTAITSYYMAQGESPFLAYEVPVRGAPWAIPMEFPLFQWMAAKLGGSDTDALRWAGRSLSLVFFLGCLWMAWLVTRRLPLEYEDRLALVLLFAAAPIFAAYSTTFLIESFALFWALAYLWAFQRLREGWRWPWLALACGFGILASLSKPTTWAPFAGVIVLATGVHLLVHWKNKGGWKPTLLGIILPAVAVLVPMLAALVWVHFGDAVKMENPLTRGLTSENLSGWNYGSLEQKLSPVVWTVILGKQGLMLFGFAVIVLPFLILAALWGAWKERGISPKLVTFLLALGGYLSAPVVFTNLHFRHDYYLFANGFFLIVAFVLGMALCRELVGRKVCRLVYGITFISALTVALAYTGLRKSLTEPQEEGVVAAIQELDSEGGVIYFGFGWSAKMPYEVERRALMLSIADPANETYLEAVELNRGEDWAAIAVSGARYSEIADDIQNRMGLDFEHRLEVWPGVRVLSREPIALDGGNSAQDLLDRLADKVPETPPEGSGFIYLHSFLNPKVAGDGPFELMYKRHTDLFYIDGGEQRLYRLRNYFE